MPLQRISDQRSATLDDFYRKVASHGETKEFGAMMRQIISFLDSHLKETVWALTSHYDLWLLSEDDYRSGWHIRVNACPGVGYQISYRVPEPDAPWQNARVEGTAKDKERALEYILIAMQRSKGWPNSPCAALSYADIDQILIPWAQSRSLQISTAVDQQEVRAVRLDDDQADSYWIAIFSSWDGKILVNISEIPDVKKRRSDPLRSQSLETALSKFRDTLDTAYFVTLGWICERGHTKAMA